MGILKIINTGELMWLSGRVKKKIPDSLPSPRNLSKM
jgi:hypothetical protein